MEIFLSDLLNFRIMASNSIASLPAALASSARLAVWSDALLAASTASLAFMAISSDSFAAVSAASLAA